MTASLTAPAYIAGETIRATLGPSTITGRVESWHPLGGQLVIHPHGLKEHQFSSVEIWAYDG